MPFISDATSGTNTLPITGTAVNPAIGTIRMNTGTNSVGEGAGAITVYAYRAGGSFGPLSCTYATADGTALAGLDYTAVSGPLTWTNGETGNKAIVVPILEDSAIEGDESFSVNLTGAAVNLPASTTITIVDNDFGVAPSIAGQPTGSTVTVGATAAFTVSANGTPTLGYQWQKEGTNLAGATGTNLTLSGVQTNQAGNYTVVVTNAWGSKTSTAAVLVVNRLAQTITFGALADKQVGDAPFTLSASASSGLPVSYTSSALGAATVSGNTVTIVGAGDTTISAKQAGDATYLPATDVGQKLHVTTVTNVATVLVDDTFSGTNGATPDATKWEWSGQVNQNGAGQLSLSTQTIDQSWLKSKAGEAPSAGQSLVAQIRAYAYAENWNPGVYGDKQPRGLRVGTDANNAIEFYSASRVSVGMRCRKAGVETTATYSLPAGVDSQHDYQISVTTTGVVFKIDGTAAGTITANLPTGVLNIYVDSYDGGGVGNVPVTVDSITLTLNAPPVTPPQIATGGTGFGIQTNRFGFNITGASGATVIVEACTNLTSGWTPVWTNTLNGGAAYFNDPQWTNYRGRFYHLRSP